MAEPRIEGQADAVVVGSGVAGALVAHELARAGARVIILEAGGRLDRADLVSRYQASWQRSPASAYPQFPHAPVPDPIAADPYLISAGADPFKIEYVRAAGGTTWHWSGNSPRFLPADFRMRTRYGVGDDWPIAYEHIEPYYVRAEWALGVAGDSADDHGSPRSQPYPMPAIEMPYADQVVARRLAQQGVAVKVFPQSRNSRPYDGRPQCCGSHSCTPICPTGAQYSAYAHVVKAEEAGARLITDAVACGLEVDDAGRVTAVQYKDPQGGDHRVAGRAVVLACHGVETPRLLLMSRSERSPGGVGNRRDQVGRYLMAHPAMGFQLLMPEPVWGGRGPLTVSHIALRRDGEFRRGHAASKWAISSTASIHAFCVDVLERERDWAGARERLEGYAERVLGIVAEFEDLPDPSNRIMLAPDRTDPLGLPRPVAQYRITDYVRAAVADASALQDRLLGWLDARGLGRSPLGEHSAHHVMGTTRMGSDPGSSVVDRDCRVHGHPNLHIAGSSVFTTAGTANPTLTIVALALRLADHLRARLAAGD